jgi:hypothetical protein
MANPDLTAGWILSLNGQSVGCLVSVAVPTETLMVIGFGSGMAGLLYDWMFQEMQGQRRKLPGNLITLDYSLRAVYCDAWDSAWIQQVEIPAVDASQASFMFFTLSLQVTNLREVPVPSPGATGRPAPVGLATPGKSKLMQRLAGRTIRSNWAIANTGRRETDVRRDFCCCAFLVTVSGSSKEYFAARLGRLAISSGVIAPFVITMVESAATDFRAWKQVGGQRDVTIKYLDPTLRAFLTIKLGGCTVAQIDPAVPIYVLGHTAVTLRVSRLTIDY